MTLYEMFEAADDDFLEFECIPPDERRHSRPDLCALLYLHEKLGGEGDAICAAEHDKIWLDFDGLERLTPEDVLYLSRCGVRYDDEIESLCMLV